MDWFILGVPCSDCMYVRRYDWLSPENEGRNLGRRGAYMEIMCKYFWKLNFYIQRPMHCWRYVRISTQKINYKKKNDHGFVTPVLKLAQPEIFNSVGRFFKPGEFFGPSPMFTFSQFISLGDQPKTSWNPAIIVHFFCFLIRQPHTK